MTCSTKYEFLSTVLMYRAFLLTPVHYCDVDVLSDIILLAWYV